MSSEDTYKTLIEIPLNIREKVPEKAVLKSFRDGSWREVTSADFFRSIEHLSFKLLSLGIKRTDRCAILSENCPEWLIADFAIMSCGAITVPLHAVLPFDQIQYILRDSGAMGIFVSHEKLLRKIKPALDSLPELKWVILFKGSCSPFESCIPWEDALQEGSTLQSRFSAELLVRKSSVLPDDVSTVIYTSGTTGDPKGVMLTHRNFLSNAEALLYYTFVISDYLI